MNYREARQIQSGPNAGKWHYTNRNDDQIYAVGACRENCPGHDTPEQAYAHEKARLVATAEIKPLPPDARAYSPGRCDAKESCTEPATHWVRLSHPHQADSIRFCDKHANLDEVEAVVVVGPSISSW